MTPKQIMADEALLDAKTPKFRFRVVLGTIGLVSAFAMLIWLITSLLGLTTTMIDVFGMTGIRIPAGIAIGGLMLAAVGFNKF